MKNNRSCGFKKEKMHRYFLGDWFGFFCGTSIEFNCFYVQQIRVWLILSCKWFSWRFLRHASVVRQEISFLFRSCQGQWNWNVCWQMPNCGCKWIFKHYKNNKTMIFTFIFCCCFCAKNLDYCFYDTDGTTILIDYCYVSYATEVYLDRYCMPRPMNVYRENIEKTVKSYFFLWG